MRYGHRVGDTPQPDFRTARDKAVALSRRMQERAGLLSSAHYFAHRLDKRARADAASADAENTRDAEALERFVAWGLRHHRAAMLAWAEEAAGASPTSATQQGWERTRAVWVGEAEVGEAPPALSWLIVMWSREAEP